MDVVKVLLEHGADASIADHEGSTALHLAARAGRCEVLRLLLSVSRAQGRLDDLLRARDGEERTAVHEAARKGKIRALETLFSFDESEDASMLNHTVGADASEWTRHGWPARSDRFFERMLEKRKDYEQAQLAEEVARSMREVASMGV